MKNAGIIEELFSQFELHLQECGYTALKGQIVDASIVKTPIQRNSREENEQIKREGKAPVQWGENKRRRKDVDARWTKKNGKPFFGYKNHISVDAKHKLSNSKTSFTHLMLQLSTFVCPSFPGQNFVQPKAV
ncbi:transposase [Desulfogranum marinum]|uniref:transposase n=1 Tax=Desulfogranum marinum TaxID=453220 RepID=UPI0029C99902|nr:transposase [Desulfogranum marinum]